MKTSDLPQITKIRIAKWYDPFIHKNNRSIVHGVAKSLIIKSENAMLWMTDPALGGNPKLPFVNPDIISMPVAIALRSFLINHANL